MTIKDTIDNAKRIQAELKVLNEQFSQLATPALSDTQNLPQIYQLILNQPDVDRREARHYFVIIVIYLYSPTSLFRQLPIKAGLRQEIGKIIGRCRQEVSGMFSQARFRYENVPSFRDQVEIIFEQIIK